MGFQSPGCDSSFSNDSSQDSLIHDHIILSNENSFGELTGNNDNVSVQANQLFELNPIASFDIGLISDEIPCNKDVENAVISGPQTHPKIFPNDNKNIRFPISLLSQRQQNGDNNDREWLVWSETNQAIYCFPCRLYRTSIYGASHLSSIDGWSVSLGWKKLYDRIPDHEKTAIHRRNYLEWRGLERRLNLHSGVDIQMEKGMSSQIETWREILKRIIDIVLFLGVRGLAFRGHSQKIGFSDNGNFLGIFELLSRYDPILREHVRNVAYSQTSGKRMPAHYLSSDSQNELISACAHHIREKIKDEIH